MEKQTRKSKLTEKWVDTYIELNSHPPTYEEIAKHFGIKNTASYNRCSAFRHKMKHHEKLDTRTKIDRVIITNLEFKKWFENNIGLNTTEKYNTFESCRMKIEKITGRKTA